MAGVLILSVFPLLRDQPEACTAQGFKTLAANLVILLSVFTCNKELINGDQCLLASLQSSCADQYDGRPSDLQSQTTQHAYRPTGSQADAIYGRLTLIGANGRRGNAVSIHSTCSRHLVLPRQYTMTGSCRTRTYSDIHTHRFINDRNTLFVRLCAWSKYFPCFDTTDPQRGERTMILAYTNL